MAKKTKKASAKKSPKKAIKKSAPKKKAITTKKTKAVKKKPAVKKAVRPVKKKASPKKVTAKKKTKPAKKIVVKKTVKKAVKKVAPKSKTKSTNTRKTNQQMTQKKSTVKVSVKTKIEDKRARYSDSELMEFKEIINRKLSDARKELGILQGILNNANNHGTDDTASTFKVLEDGSDTLAKEEAGVQAARQKKFIEQLENALIRIENKTYGICRVTGKLIQKERLRAVPHTTQSIEAKLQQYHD
ncbi:MAG TPA: molecular chaperone DnaK [Bacteroidia bacterium]|nr:molecular chaperone DnaK [Bacteroidia bacterium]HNT79863.1 molecular chaperone DnaK [Bacteroidia bacterium]